MNFLDYWDTRIDKHEKLFNVNPGLANFAFSECQTLFDVMEKDANRYIWLLAHMGRVEQKARQWNPRTDKPLLIWLQDFIDEEMPKAGSKWIEKQRKMLNDPC